MLVQRLFSEVWLPAPAAGYRMTVIFGRRSSQAGSPGRPRVGRRTTQLTPRWPTTSARLEAARRGLTNPGDQSVALYLDFLGHHELGLALEVLAGLADAQGAPREVWVLLADAADSMDLADADEAHDAAARLIGRHLAPEREPARLSADPGRSRRRAGR